MGDGFDGLHGQVSSAALSVFPLLARRVVGILSQEQIQVEQHPIHVYFLECMMFYLSQILNDVYHHSRRNIFHFLSS